MQQFKVRETLYVKVELTMFLEYHINHASEKRFLISVFLEKRIDYSHGFSSVFFSLHTSDQTSSTPKDIQSIKKPPNCTQGTEPKRSPA